MRPWKEGREAEECRTLLESRDWRGRSSKLGIGERAEISCSQLDRVRLEWRIIGRTNDRLYESNDSREILKGSVFSLGVPLCVVEYEVEVDDRLKKLRSFGGGEGYRMSAQWF